VHLKDPNDRYLLRQCVSSPAEAIERAKPDPTAHIPGNRNRQSPSTTGESPVLRLLFGYLTSLDQTRPKQHDTTPPNRAQTNSLPGENRTGLMNESGGMELDQYETHW